MIELLYYDYISVYKWLIDLDHRTTKLNWDAFANVRNNFRFKILNQYQEKIKKNKRRRFQPSGMFWFLERGLWDMKITWDTKPYQMLFQCQLLSRWHWKKFLFRLRHKIIIFFEFWHQQHLHLCEIITHFNCSVNS